MTTVLERRTNLPISEAAYWRDIALNLDLHQRLYLEQLGCITFDVLSADGSAERGFSCKVRITRALSAPAVITKLFGRTTCVEEHWQYDPARRALLVRTVPDKLSERILLQSEFHVERAGDGIVEVTRRSVQCDVFGVGALLERFAAASFEEGDVEREGFLRRAVAEHAARAH
ncbi:MAG: hypothetical protein RL385_5779 [Pseudomonadota bacterium]|jgi:hypothetical protein